MKGISIARADGIQMFLYMNWFVDEFADAGYKIIKASIIPREIRVALGRLTACRLWDCGKRIVCGSHQIELMAWPQCYFHKIIPMMWDLWPDFYNQFLRFIKRNRVDLVFCTARQSVEWLRNNTTGVEVVWVPEAVQSCQYPIGPKLSERRVDALSYGREIGDIHKKVAKYAESSGVNYQRGIGGSQVDLVKAIQNAKISICYPLSDTNPQKAQGVETLTIRYWEAMLCGAIIVGHAPRELIDVCGYNPVIEAGENIEKVLGDILSHLDRYQDLADKNRSTAERLGDWSARMKIIEDALGRGAAKG